MTLLYPGINLGRAQSGQQTNSKLMKNKSIKKVTVVKELTLQEKLAAHMAASDRIVAKVATQEKYGN